jgi:hypothetical protein
MIKILMFLVLIFLLFWACRFVIGYFNLVITRRLAFKNFLSIDKKITEAYKDIKTASKYISEYVETEPSLKTIDRKIALNYIVLQTLDDNIDEGVKRVIREMEISIKEDKEAYNKLAYKLKYALEVFPSSYIGRLIEMRTLDFFKFLK